MKREFFFQKYQELGNRTHRVYGALAILDFTPYYNSFSLAFIEAYHRYENVLLNSENALKLLRKGTGVDRLARLHRCVEGCCAGPA